MNKFTKGLFEQTLLCFSCVLIFSLKIYSQPGPSELCMLVYDKYGKLLTLQNDIELFSYIPKSNRKANGNYITYQEKACNGDIAIICAGIFVEAPTNIVSIIYKKDTMNIVINDYSKFGFKLFIDSLVFSKGWYELKNENSVSFNGEQNEIENKMNLVYDPCFSNLAKISKKYIIPFVSTLPKSPR